MTPAEASAAREIERIARAAYGKLLAWLAWQWRDIEMAEDALADAMATALVAWRREGVPPNPEGWLLTTAKRNLLHEARRRRTAMDPRATVLMATEEDAVIMPPEIPDDRMRLLFACAHPAIDETLRPALMLQTVMGLDAAKVAAGFLVTKEAMMKRLTRAKAKIRESGIRFEEPERRDLPPRVRSVLEAIYAAWTLHWDHPEPAVANELASEALYLSNLVAATLPAHADAVGLAALLELCEARRPAQVSAAGVFVPLDQQNAALWDAQLIESATQRVIKAGAMGDVGPFQLEAAIQLAHCSRRTTGATPWNDICALYERLCGEYPTVGAEIGFSIAIAHARRDYDAALARLEALAGERTATHQSWWAAKAHILMLAERNADALPCAAEALRLSRSAPLQRHWESILRTLRGPLH